MVDSNQNKNLEESQNKLRISDQGPISQQPHPNHNNTSSPSPNTTAPPYSSKNTSTLGIHYPYSNFNSNSHSNYTPTLSNNNSTTNISLPYTITSSMNSTNCLKISSNNSGQNFDTVKVITDDTKYGNIINKKGILKKNRIDTFDSGNEVAVFGEGGEHGGLCQKNLENLDRQENDKIFRDMETQTDLQMDLNPEQQNAKNKLCSCSLFCCWKS